MLQELFEEAGVRMPNFFIAGAPKCGTTAMAASLAQHPDIFMSPRKEPHAFGADLVMRSRIKPEEYVALFEGAADESRVGEASVWYLRSRTAAQEIHAFSPEARIVVMIRNPVDAVYSLHGQLVLNGSEPIRDFRAALAAEPDRRLGRRPRIRARYPAGVLYSEAVAFGSQLARYFEVFARDNVHVVIFDDLLNDPFAVMRETQSFLEVRIVDGFPLLHANKGRAVRSPHLQRLFNQPSPFVHSLARRLLPKVTGRVIRQRLREANLRPGPRPSLPPSMRAELTERFRPEVERLALLLNRDLSSWTAPPRSP